MIVLTVLTFDGAAVNIAPVGFDEIGGTIGRADTNQLVLADIERTISRVHAQVVFRAGRYALIDRGSNAVLHNGQPIGNGREALLVVGDEIRIGGYAIKVSDGAAAKSDDPFASFDGGGGRNVAATQVRSKPEMHAAVASSAPKPVQASALPPATNRALPGIPHDWDPFQRDPPEPGHDRSLDGRGNATASKPDDARTNPSIPGSLLAQQSNAQSLDALFGLANGAPSGDPLAGSSLLAEQVQPNTSGNADPMRALLMQPAVAGVKTSSDHHSDLQAPWPDSPPAMKAASPAALPGAVLSWDQPPSPVAPARVAIPPVLASSANTVVSAPELGSLNRPTQAAQQSPPAPLPEISRSLSREKQHASAPSADVQDLLEAFMKGLGAPNLRLGPLNADAMFQLGQLLRESTKGTVELLAARTALKKEVRAEVTVMASYSNNVLKFSPTVEFALQHLLGPPTAGFMQPVESMRDAYDDLKIHQLGVMAGMRAALSEVLKRFDPAVLEEKLANRATWSDLIPSNKKARLWELFQELFGQLSHEAQEDFDELLGKSFAREYERYVAQLNTAKQP